MIEDHLKSYRLAIKFYNLLFPINFALNKIMVGVNFIFYFKSWTSFIILINDLTCINCNIFQFSPTINFLD